MRKRLNVERLGQLLGASSLSQNHWALKLGLSRGHWSDIVNGRHPFPSERTRLRMLEVFGVPEHDLFADDPGAGTDDDIRFRRALSSRFTLTEEVGHGGMGTVYLAHDLRLTRSVAIKVVSPEATAGVGADRLAQEIAHVAHLHHPNILPLFDAGAEAGQPYYVMPYVPSGSLRARLKSVTRLPLNEALDLLDDIASALGHAHAQGILHCDVKPENVLVSARHAWVMDFGIARKLHSEADEWLGMRGELGYSAGTPAYVSPEQAAGDRDVDQRSDVFSLACVAYEMLAGRAPYTGRTTREVVSRRFLAPPPPLRDFAPEVPRMVERVIARGMAFSPDARPPTAPAFAAELRAAAAHASALRTAAFLAITRGLSRARALFGLAGPARLRLPFTGMAQDVHVTLRGMQRGWRFALSVVLTLALGVGVGMPALNLADHLLLRVPPGITDADRVVRLTKRIENANGVSYQRGQTGLDYNAFREHARTLSGLAGYTTRSMSLGRGEAARSVQVVMTTASYFDVLGVRLHAGRSYTEEEDVEGMTSAPCVISYRFWQRDLGGASDAIGRTLLIGSVAYTVTGIAGEGFNGIGLNAVDVFVPVHVGAPDFQGRDPLLWTTDRSAWLTLIARLRPGVSVVAADEDANAVYRLPGAYTRDRDRTNRLQWESIVPGRSLGGSRTTTLTLWLVGGTALLFVLVIANLVNLFAARTAADARQIAVRFAVGGGRAHLLRLYLVEAAALGLLAAVVGIGLSAPGVAAARSLLLPAADWTRPVVDLRAAMLTIVVAVTAAGVTALWTTLAAARIDPAELLRASGSARGGSAAGARRIRGLLLAVQATVFSVLLTAAGAFVMSVRRAAQVDVGFALDGVMVAQAPLQSAGYTREQEQEFYRDARERIGALPGVVSASLGYMEPWANNTNPTVRIRGSDVGLPDMTLFDFATPEYLQTFGVAMKAGRWIDVGDRQGTEPVAVVNETFARLGWPDGNPLGGCLLVEPEPSRCLTVVGVVSDFRVTGGVEGPLAPVYYLPFAQAGPYARSPRLFVRASRDDPALLAAVRQTLQASAPDVPAASAHYLRDNIAWLTAPLALGAGVLTVFGILATLVAGVGLAGVLSALVTQERRAHAIRAALGAPRMQVAAPLVARAAAVVGGGMLVGFWMLVPLRSIMEPMLFQTRLIDPVVVAAVFGAGLAVAALAVFAPVRRLLRIDPMHVLRAD